MESRAREAVVKELDAMIQSYEGFGYLVDEQEDYAVVRCDLERLVLAFAKAEVAREREGLRDAVSKSKTDGANAERALNWMNVGSQIKEARAEQREADAAKCKAIYNAHKKSGEYPVDLGGLALECAKAIRKGDGA